MEPSIFKQIRTVNSKLSFFFISIKEGGDHLWIEGNGHFIMENNPTPLAWETFPERITVRDVAKVTP